MAKNTGYGSRASRRYLSNVARGRSLWIAPDVSMPESWYRQTAAPRSSWWRRLFRRHE